LKNISKSALLFTFAAEKLKRIKIIFIKKKIKNMEDNTMKKEDIEDVVGKFVTESHEFGKHRYSSFDYCYNYFHETEDLTKDMEKSCMELSFYLSSWGMLRGSFLLDQSAKYYEGTIDYINGLKKEKKYLWDIDVDKYDDSNIKEILDIYKYLKKSFVKKGSRSLTLATKMMLGIFGFVPAYDTNFCDSFKEIAREAGEKCRFTAFNKESLEFIKKFYNDNKDVIDKLSKKTVTYDFLSGEKTKIHYTKAKIIDMYGFMLYKIKDMEKKKNSGKMEL
jgi:hypothetical protein